MEIINIIDIIDIRSINEIIVLNLDLYNFISLVRFNNSSKGSLIAQDVENLLKNEFFLFINDRNLNSLYLNPFERFCCNYFYKHFFIAI